LGGTVGFDEPGLDFLVSVDDGIGGVIGVNESGEESLNGVVDGEGVLIVGE